MIAEYFSTFPLLTSPSVESSEDWRPDAASLLRWLASAGWAVVPSTDQA